VLDEIVAATSNAGKLREIRAILAGLPVPIQVRGLDEFAPLALPEEGDDYASNAAAKARTAAIALGRFALADDSGLEVEGLGGAPGPQSARYGGAGLGDAQRTAKLLEALAGMHGDARRARFVCVAALALPDGTEIAARGECEGRILTAPRGGGGFGYDPIFEVGEGGRSLAELPAATKNRVSHRALAFAALREPLRALADPPSQPGQEADESRPTRSEP
jgi:XTP/dITP diphosphohydrolase